jgi:hypothetical protein
MGIFGNWVDTSGKIIKDIKSWKIKNPNSLCFQSHFEWECYKLLIDNKFNFDFQPETRELVPSFESFALSKGKEEKIIRSTVRKISYTPDFLIYTDGGWKIYLEAKGFFQPDARMRYKLFQNSLKMNEMSLIVFDSNNNLRDLKRVINIVNKKYGGSTIKNKPEIKI